VFAGRSRIRVSIEIFVERNSGKWMIEIRSFRSKFTTKFSFNFRSIKIEIFPFRIKKIVVFQKKIWFWRIDRKYLRISRKFRTNFAKKILTKIFVFAHIFVAWTKFSRKRLNENVETLTGMQFSAEKMQEFKSTQFH